jgi:hypothetical protein
MWCCSCMVDNNWREAGPTDNTQLALLPQKQAVKASSIATTKTCLPGCMQARCPQRLCCRSEPLYQCRITENLGRRECEDTVQVQRIECDAWASDYTCFYLVGSSTLLTWSLCYSCKSIQRHRAQHSIPGSSSSVTSRGRSTSTCIRNTKQHCST